MKFFHLSDLHIGLKLMNRDLREDQEYILDEITELARRERPDAVVIAGDLKRGHCLCKRIASGCNCDCRGYL